MPCDIYSHFGGHLMLGPEEKIEILSRLIILCIPKLNLNLLESSFQAYI